MPSISSIARELGLAPSTVSMALRRQPGVAAATVRRVCALAKLREYRTDPLLAAAATRRRTRSVIPIAFVQWPESGPRRNYRPFVAEARRRGMRVDLVLRDKRSDPTLVEQLRSSGYRAVILAVNADRGLEDLDWSGLTMVAIGIGSPDSPYPRVALDVSAAMRLAHSRLQAEGYRRIGIACPQDNLDEERSWRLRAAALALATDIPALITGASNRSNFLAWLHEHQPDAVLGTSPGIAAWLPPGIASAWLDCDPQRHHRLRGVEMSMLSEIVFDHLEDALRQGRVGLPKTPYTILTSPRWFHGALANRSGTVSS
ncbi:MAG: hypothetical protein AAB263_08900 [Planctomycetota bacterium]